MMRALHSIAVASLCDAVCVICVICGLLGAMSCSRANSDDSVAAQIIALERDALERWGKGDPQGFFEIMASDETYFDPVTAKRIDGLDALRQYIAPFVGKISIERVEMIDPKVQQYGAIAVLTFNLANYGARFDGGPASTALWNSTEVFQNISGQWRITHSHWSYTRPAVKQLTP
jgi:ketosteroid isomerase-like protein